ncbi:MAG: triose-phosphate isomerase [Firmicutes bacterium]|jgi:triosephosphate isomerase|nr:triose-phosphate isomerase [Bacillota bacterium]
MRTPLIAANWKMHKALKEAVDFVGRFAALASAGSMEIVICPAFVHLAAVGEICQKHGIKLGAQNMFWEATGAFTGEISPPMLKDLGVDYVIIGHSERREHFAENDRQIARKVKAAFQFNLVPILCVGETLQQRRASRTMDVIAEQVNGALSGLDPSWVRRIVIAYEPVWAIGSGLAATGSVAGAAGAWIRATIGEMFSLDVARAVRILYGGSVQAENIEDFLRETDIDGALVGGASLDADNFARLVNRAQEAVTA